MDEKYSFVILFIHLLLALLFFYYLHLNFNWCIINTEFADSLKSFRRNCTFAWFSDLKFYLRRFQKKTNFLIQIKLGVNSLLRTTSKNILRIWLRSNIAETSDCKYIMEIKKASNMTWQILERCFMYWKMEVWWRRRKNSIIFLKFLFI